MFDFFFERVVMLSLPVSSRNGNRLKRPDKIRIASQAPDLLNPTAKRYPLRRLVFEHYGRALCFAVSQVSQLHWCCLLCSVLLVVTARQEVSGSGTIRSAAAILVGMCQFSSVAASVEVPGPLSSMQDKEDLGPGVARSFEGPVSCASPVKRLQRSL